MSIEFQSSRLGTKEHWDSVYDEELANFREIGDEGEIWFGAESVKRMVEWASKNVPLITTPSIIEIGTGNGTLLFELCEVGYVASHLFGIDYSSGAIELAKSIAATRKKEIPFHICDILQEYPPIPAHAQGDTSLGVWDLVLDKGTFDAIALGEKNENGDSPAKNYPYRISKLLKPGGYFLITSCNFTEDELQAQFVTVATGLIYHSRIQHPIFTFGGKKGSAYCSVAFRKAVL